MVAAAFIGPGTVTTATIAGAGYGYTLLWAIAFSIIATYVLQEMSARLGVMSGSGVGKALRMKVATGILRPLSFILVLGAILIGNAAYEAGNIAGAALGFAGRLGDSAINPAIPIIGFVAFALLFTGKYKLIEKSLVAMVSVMGIVFILAAILVEPDWSDAFAGLLKPVVPEGGFLMVVGLIGTTVVPYNLFLHASSAKQRWQGAEDLPKARWDTAISVIVGGLITMAILIASAAAYDGLGQTVNTSTDLARQLTPLLGDWSEIFIAFGFLAAGLSSSITAPLAAAFATTDILGWKDDLRSTRFRVVWIFVLLIGLTFALLGTRPTKVILFAQIANGILLPVIAAFLLWLANDREIMGSHTNTTRTNIFGIVIILITTGLGIKGVLSGLGIF